MLEIIRLHGRHHSPRSGDPSLTEEWHYCGDADEPAFINSWTGTLKFKLAVGAPDSARRARMVAGTLTGGTEGTQVTTFPIEYADEDLDIWLPFFRTDGTVVPLIIKTDATVWLGV